MKAHHRLHSFLPVDTAYLCTRLVQSLAPGDYENWEGTLIKLGGHNINLGGGTNGQN